MFYTDQLNVYYEILEKKFRTGNLSHEQFAMSLTKLDDWYEQFVSKYGEEEYE